MPRSRGVWLQTGYVLVNGFIDDLYQRLGNTSNYSAIADLNTLRITTRKVFPAYVSNSRSLATASNSWDSLAFHAHVSTVRRISRNWTHPACLGTSLFSLGADPTENTASNNFSIVTGGCLDIVDVFTGPRDRCIAMVLHVTISKQANEINQ
jgi:hypothetical protein